MTRIETEDLRGNAIIVDTNIPVLDPPSISTLQDNGANSEYIIRGVLYELDGLKNRPEIGIDARESLNNIEEERQRADSKLIITSKLRWKEVGSCDKTKVDNQLIAAANEIYNENLSTKRYKKIKLLTNDTTVRILARETFLGKKNIEVESYQKDERDVIRYEPPIEIEVKHRHIEHGKIVRGVDLDDSVRENQGVILVVKETGDKKTMMPAIRKGDDLVIVPFDIIASSISPKSLNGNGTNWQQYFALAQLLDPEIDLVFLMGNAGTGKTLLTLAAAVENRKAYKNILVSRPMVALEDDAKMGFLPGNIDEKMGPWLRPIYQNLDVLKEEPKNKALIDKMLVERKIDIEPLDYIRGTTFSRCFLFIDEAQNLSPHQVKTIITRAGEGTKIVFTGDLGQIDKKRRLSSRSCGINYAANAMNGLPMVGVTSFKDTVRSKLVEAALECLK